MIRRTIRGLGLAALLVACSDPTTPTGTLAPRDRPAFSLGLPNGATADTLLVGETVQLTEALPKRKGKTLATATVWSSSNASVASVSSQGLVTGVAAGSAVITASNSLASEKATILVQAAPAQAAPAPAPAPTPTPAPSASAPELPRVYVNTDPVTPTGTTRSVAAGGDLQGALNAAQPGDVIVLAAGATYSGNFVLPVKSGDAWITIRAGAGTTLPAAGQRVTPAYASTMPKLLTPNSMSALATAPGAHHYRIVGVEIGATASVSSIVALLSLGTAGSDQSTLAQVPHHLVFERVYVHGSATLDVRRCVALNSATTAIIDSYVADCHSRTNDSQAIGGWNGPGPFKIVNNYLEGAGENVMFGGSDPSIADLVPSDIEMRRNHVVKPLTWQRESWIIKNLFELKSARRVLVEANVFENCWAAQQNGFAILWKSVNQDGGAPWSITSDVTFQYNVVRRVGGAINMAARPETHPALPAARFRIAHNVFELVGDASMGGTGRLWQINEVQGVELAHNTGLATSHGIALYGAPTSAPLVVRDNIFGGAPAVASLDGRGAGTAALDYHFPGWTMRGNLALGVQSWDVYPAGNLYPTSASAGGLSADLRVVAAPALGYATTDGLPVGADRTAVEQRTSGVIVP